METAQGRGRILLALENRENVRLIEQCLDSRYEILTGDVREAAFDLCLVDAVTLARWAAAIRARRAGEEPVLLPFLLIAPREHARIMAHRLRDDVDDVVFAPVEKLELQARVEVLLRARRLSLALKLRNDDLEAFIYAMTHDLRAPLRSIAGFAELIAEEQSERLDETGRHQLQRIAGATREMTALIASLVEFTKLGRKAIRPRNVTVAELMRSWLDDMGDPEEAGNVTCEIAGDPGVTMYADPALLKIAVRNLLSNAVKFVAPGIKPHVRVGAVQRGPFIRICVEDNGIGVPPEAQERIFAPFARLHGVEDYPGTGLGLAAVRKCAELLGGRAGVESEPGRGSTFWIDVPSGGQA